MLQQKLQLPWRRHLWCSGKSTPLTLSCSSRMPSSCFLLLILIEVLIVSAFPKCKFTTTLQDMETNSYGQLPGSIMQLKTQRTSNMQPNRTDQRLQIGEVRLGLAGMTSMLQLRYIVYYNALPLCSL